MKAYSLNADWLFSRDRAPEEKSVVQLPHDAMISEPRSADNMAHTGYYPGGSYCYEKRIFGAPELAGKRLIVEFEGVYMDSHVFLNGEELGGHYYGYTDFTVDITGKLRSGEENLLTVTVNNSDQPNSRWYSGSGIYRDVWLWVGGEESIAPDGLRVKTLSIEPPEVLVSCTAPDGCTLHYEVFDGEVLLAAADGEAARISLPEAQCWSAETPKLYTLKACLLRSGEVLDMAEQRFGIRVLVWNGQEGLLVNGTSVKLKGGCVHHDHGLLGAAAYEKAELRRVAKLKEMGYNALRCAHNPAGKALLRACDMLGMYVIDEAFDQWQVPQTECDYAKVFDREWRGDIASMVEKDYNHPCVIAYCVGNEITVE